MTDDESRRLADVLSLTANRDTWQEIRRTQALAVHRVLAWAWNPGRLARARERLAAGERAPAISVIRYRLNGEAWYVVGDGHHRTVAARNAGFRTIRAVLEGEVLCEPGLLYLDRASGRLWRDEGQVSANGHAVLVLAADDIGEDKAAALLAAGVNDLAKGVVRRSKAE